MMKFRLLVLAMITNISMAQDMERMYQDVTEKVNEINKFRDYETLTMDSAEIKGEFDGTAWLSGFYKNDEIERITLVVEDNIGIVAFNYYLTDGKLIYVSETFDQFTAPDKKKTNRTFRGRYFFQNNKMFDYDAAGHNRFDNAKLDRETVLLAEAKKNIELLNRKKMARSDTR